MNATGPTWVVQGQSYDRYSTNKGKVLSTDFVSVDGSVYHLQSGDRPKGPMTLSIPFKLFMKDESEAL